MQCFRKGVLFRSVALLSTPSLNQLPLKQALLLEGDGLLEMLKLCDHFRFIRLGFDVAFPRLHLHLLMSVQGHGMARGVMILSLLRRNARNIDIVLPSITFHYNATFNVYCQLCSRGSCISSCSSLLLLPFLLASSAAASASSCLFLSPSSFSLLFRSQVSCAAASPD